VRRARKGRAVKARRTRVQVVIPVVKGILNGDAAGVSMMTGSPAGGPYSDGGISPKSAGVQSGGTSDVWESEEEKEKDEEPVLFESDPRVLATLEADASLREWLGVEDEEDEEEDEEPVLFESDPRVAAVLETDSSLRSFLGYQE
jgi:hypothetical protein